MCLCEYLYMCVCMCMHQFLLRGQKMVLSVLCLSQGVLCLSLSADCLSLNPGVFSAKLEGSKPQPPLCLCPLTAEVTEFAGTPNLFRGCHYILLTLC